MSLPRQIDTTAPTYNGCNGNNFPHEIASQLTEHLAKRNEGRTSAFTLDKAEIIIDSLRDGSTEQQACDNAGVNRLTFKAWCRFSPEFLLVVTEAQEDRADSMVDNSLILLADVDTEGREAMARLRKAEQIARYRMDIAKCLNFKKYGDKRQSLNLNLNADVTPADVSKWFNP